MTKYVTIVFAVTVPIHNQLQQIIARLTRIEEAE